MEKIKEVKDMSIYEASDFWDEHDFDEFGDFEQVMDIQFSLKKKKYVGIDINLFTIIKKQAQKLHKTEEALINEWLNEKVGI